MYDDYTKETRLMQNPECPRCQKAGKVKAKGSAATITCPLCKGLGEIPPLHAVVESETSLALYYWECACDIKKYDMTLSYVHPSNHEVCEKCGAEAKNAPRSPAGYAQAFYSILYDLDMDIEYPPDKTE
jgi:hypothetical protein